MKIGFVVNDIETEKAEYTTNRLAMAAKEMGHEAWYMGIGDFAYEPDGSLSTKARAGHAKSYRSLERHLDDVKKPDVEQLIGMDEFDVVMLRNDPADDAETDPWRNNAGVAFGQLIASTGVLVVNDPTSLANALSKAYFQHFPEIVRPADPHLARRGHDRGVHQGPRWQGRAQAAPGIGRRGSLPDRPQGGAQPQADHRGDLARRLRRRPGVPPRGGQRRRADVRDER